MDKITIKPGQEAMPEEKKIFEVEQTSVTKREVTIEELEARKAENLAQIAYFEECNAGIDTELTLLRGQTG